MLHLANFKKAYHSNPVLNIPDLVLPPGIYWLKGGNGAGKTTLLKSIAGLVPFEGSVFVDGINLRKQRMHYTRHVSFAEAEPVYPPFFTGAELLKFYRQTKGTDGSIGQEIINQFDMTTYLSKKISTYSSGMVKKLSLLLAFTGAPQLILLDEPFITLDVAAVEILQALIAMYNKRGVSFLISSHQELRLATTYKTLHIRQQTVIQESHVAGID